MKLFDDILDNLLLEADISRRNFLKSASGTALSLLTGGGIPLNLAKTALSKKPLFMRIVLSSMVDMDGLSTDWHNPNLISNELHDIIKIFDIFNSAGIKFYVSPQLDAAMTFEAYAAVSDADLSKLINKNVKFNLADSGGYYDEVFEGNLSLGSMKSKHGFQIDISKDVNDLHWKFNSAEGGIIADHDLLSVENINSLILDYWNNYAINNPEALLANHATINKLRKAFGNRLLAPSFGYEEGWSAWDKDVKEYIKSRESQDEDEGGNSGEGDEEDRNIDAFDEYDEYSKERWSSEGGYTESINRLRQMVLSEAISLSEALDRINILGKDKFK